MGETELSLARRYVSSLANGTAVWSGGSEIPPCPALSDTGPMTCLLAYGDLLGPAEAGEVFILTSLDLGEGNSGEGEGDKSVAQCFEKSVSTRWAGVRDMDGY